MGLATYSIGKYGRDRGRGAASLMGEYLQGGAHATTATGSNLTDGAAGAGSEIQVAAGQILAISIDVTARVRFGGNVATPTEGHVVAAGHVHFFEVPTNGTISVCDV